MSVAPITPSFAVTKSSGDMARGAAPQTTKSGGAFMDFVRHTNQQLTGADQAVEKLATNQGGSLHNVVVAAAKADLSFRLFLELRNKLVESYQELMRMQV